MYRYAARLFASISATTCLKLILIYLILLGCLFRLVNIDSKVFWVDEVSTAIRVSGFTRHQVTAQLLAKAEHSHLITPADLIAYQLPTRPSPRQHTWRALLGSPEHAPLYFWLTRLWLDLWGYSITNLRSLSVLFSLSCLPAMYWCSWELFRSRCTSAIATALLAISPFYVAYAQEARPYSLWTLLILMASAILLRSPWTARSLKLYSLTLTLSLYTSILSIFVVFSHFIFITAQEKWRWTGKLQQTIGAIALSLLCFSPWLWLILTQIQTLQDNTTWMRVAMAGWAMVAIWLYSIVIVFVDFPVYLAADPVILGAICADLILLGIIGYAFYSLRNHRQLPFRRKSGTIPREVGSSPTLSTIQSLSESFSETGVTWRFVMSLAMVPFATLVILDWIQGGQTSTAPRYLIPLHLSVVLAIAHLFRLKLWQRSRSWQFLFIGIIAMATISCATNLEDSPRYQKTRNLHNGAIAQLINQTPRLLVEDINMMDLLSLSHSLDPSTRIQLVSSEAPLIPITQSTFLFNPSPAFLNHIRANVDLKVQQVYQPKVLIPGEIALSLFWVSLSN